MSIEPGVLSAQDNLAVSQGYGGSITSVYLRSMHDGVDWNRDGAIDDLDRKMILCSFHAMPEEMHRTIGGGRDRAVYLSSGDVNGDGVDEIVTTFGPITEEARYPNIVIVRNFITKKVIAHPFCAFPHTIPDSTVNYLQGELRSAIGDFIGAGKKQIAIAQGYGGNGYIRLFQYTGEAAPYGWKIVGQFTGFQETGLHASAGNRNGGVTLAAGDLDGDSLDELVIGQTNSESSSTIFQTLDIQQTNGQGSAHVDSFHEGIAFPGVFCGDGGIELAVADLNRDGTPEIIASTQGNSRAHKDPRDEAPANLYTIISPIVKDKKIAGFIRTAKNSFVSTFDSNANPSGALSLAVGEFDDHSQNGKEIIVGTGCIYQWENSKIRLVKPAPIPIVCGFRFEFVSDGRNGIIPYGSASYLQGPDSYINAFQGDLIPKSGAIFLSSGKY